MRSLSQGAQIVDGRLSGASFLKQRRLQTVFALLNADGEEARAVGGAVRNALLGEPVADIDIATTALPQLVVARAKAAGVRAIPTGIEHGTVTLLVDGETFEVTTLRQDIATDGRRAVVEFGRDFEADAQRRDFTINALSVNADGVVFDYCNGLADIAARHVRFIGDAGQRIREDYLRILRLFRFHAAYGEGAVERDALQAAIGLRDGLQQLSRERVRMELLKLLQARRAPQAVSDMLDAGLLGPMLAGVASPARLARMMAIEAQEALPDDRGIDAIRRLMAMGVEVQEDAARLRERLRLSNAEEVRLAQAMAVFAAIRSLRYPAEPPPPSELFRLLFLYGRMAARDGAAYAHAANLAAPDDGRWASVHAFLRDTPEPRLPFTGADLVQRGLVSGPAIGAALKRLQAAWIRAGFPREPEVLARLLEDCVDPAHTPRV